MKLLPTSSLPKLFYHLKLLSAAAFVLFIGFPLIAWILIWVAYYTTFFVNQLPFPPQ